MKFYIFLSCLIFTTHVSVNGQFDVLCPPALKHLYEATKCEGIKCVSTLRQRDCPAGTILEENVAVCKCCPGCVKYERGFEEAGCLIAFNETYDPTCTARICPVVRQCRRGLTCRLAPDGQNRCLVPEPEDIPVAPNCAGLCWIKQAVAENSNWDWDWSNACTPDGYFKPVQCKGSIYRGDCFCVDKCGEKIFGRARKDKAGSQTCECSRRAHELKQVSGRIATLHCTEEGNYEALQCDTDSSLCYCLDPATGKLTGEVLPENQWKNLPCYNSSSPNLDDNGRYLRRCESEWAAAAKIRREAQLHGLKFDHRSLTLNCDYDGSFAPRYTDVVNNRDFCAHKDGSQIAGYFRTLNEKVPMDCNCARDTVYYSIQGLDFIRTCDTRLTMGNYMPWYINGEFATCVDSDGYNYGPEVPSAYSCCLDTLRNDQNEMVTTCPDETLPNCVNYKQCALYSRLIRDHYITSG